LLFIFQAAGSGTKTATEATLGTFLVTSSNLDLVNYEITSLNAFGAPPLPIQRLIYPFSKSYLSWKTGNLGNIQILFQYNAELPEPTEDMAAQVTVAYDDGSHLKKLLINFLVVYMVWFTQLDKLKAPIIQLLVMLFLKH